MSDLTFDKYEVMAKETANYPWSGSASGLLYATIAMSGESGEYSNEIKKMLRDDGGTLNTERRERLILELGDILWYVSANCRELGVTMAEVAERNHQKLKARYRGG